MWIKSHNGTEMPEYQRRVVDDELDELMPTLPAIALEGPKGGGKTATAGHSAKLAESWPNCTSTMNQCHLVKV